MSASVELLICLLASMSHFCRSSIVSCCSRSYHAWALQLLIEKCHIKKMATRDAMLHLVEPILPRDPKKIDGEDHANIC
jgi:hypothetical protein